MPAGHKHHVTEDYTRAFVIGIALNLGFVIIEAAYALSANSMALFADAGHNLSDVFGLLVALVGAAMARESSTALYVSLEDRPGDEPVSCRGHHVEQFRAAQGVGVDVARRRAERIRALVHDRFGIEHATIQIERENLRDADC